MTRLRRTLGPLAAVWLICQAATLVLATAAFGFDAVAVSLIECTCAHGASHTDCPMHRQSPPSRPGLDQLQCADEGDFASLGSLLSHVGLAPAPTRAARSASSPAAVPIDVTPRALRTAPPDPPPPRA